MKELSLTGLCLPNYSERMTAEQCLNHTWLRRITTPKIKTSSSMEVAKDNLKQFVERWNEHPNSPYVFEVANQLILPPLYPLKLSDSSHSLSGMSPSPCGSLASSQGSDDAFLPEAYQNGNVLPIPYLDHFRRASDSSCIIKGTDIAERVNLAEEIKKLSDKLFKLSTVNTSITNPEFEKSLNFDSKESKISPRRSREKSLEHATKNINHKEIHSEHLINIERNHTEQLIPKQIPKSEPINITKSQNSEVPWRRPKFKINNMSRDVPVSHKKSSPSFQEQFNARLSIFNKPENTTKSNNPNDTKDMLLQLLEQWDGPHGTRLKQRHASISSEWSENESLGQKTISSLNMFFQSRATNKKITQFHKS